MFEILQWNMNGFFNNYNELEIILKEYSPQFVSIQETHLPFNFQPYTSNHYSSYFFNFPHNSTGKQGVGVMIKKNIAHKVLEIPANIANIIIEVNFGFKFHIISVYIPPNQKFCSSDLTSILSSIRTPFFLIGDFNAWSPLWGSRTSNPRGDAIESVILDHGLTVLNDGAPTHFSTHQSFTHVDLSICSNSIAPKADSRTLSDLFGSDHFPILTKFNIGSSPIIKPKPKFLTDRADWERFSSLACTLNRSSSSSSAINKETAAITKIIRQSAHYSIPQSSSRSTKKSVPWWSPELNNLRMNKQQLWGAYKRNRSINNLIEYKKANALFKRSAKQAKKDSFTHFTNAINSTSSVKKIWADIKLISGNYKSNNFIPHIDTPSGPITVSADIANFFAQSWSRYSSDDNFSRNFVLHKNKVLDTPYAPTHLTAKASNIEIPISLDEYSAALNATKGKTPGGDRVSYPMIKNLPMVLKSRVIDLFNMILDQGIYPQCWKQAIVIPIPKPGKSKSSIEGFRPISLLPCLGKLLEKIVAKRIMWFALSNNYLSPNQVAFKSKHSTLDALLQFDHFASSALSKKTTYIGIEP